MAKSYLFSFGFGWKSRQQSILEIEEDFLSVLYQLSDVDMVFSRVMLSKENQKDAFFEISNETKFITLNSLANTILNFSKYDVRKYEKEFNPTVEYSRSLGFTFVATFFEDQNECFSFSIRMGSNESNGIGSLSFSKEYNKDFDWYFKMLKVLVDKCYANVGGVNFRGAEFLNSVSNVRRPLGWISCFSFDYELPIPDDLSNIEYVYTDKGKYLILTRLDFTLDKETYLSYKLKLLNIMQELCEKVPDYGSIE